MKDSIHNVHIVDERVLITPDELKAKLPLEQPLRQNIERFRQEIADIVHRRDKRYWWCVVSVPFTIFLRQLSMQKIAGIVGRIERSTIYRDAFILKPRTTVGWKGLINDPNLMGRLMLKRGYI